MHTDDLGESHQVKKKPEIQSHKWFMFTLD